MTNLDLGFDELPRVTLSAQVADKLRLRIESKGLGVGERLPSERELSEMFRVSRVAVREAFQLLQAQGYVDIRQGKGAFVVDPQVRQASSLQTWVGNRDDDLVMMIELRMIVEPGVAELAARKVTVEEGRQLIATAHSLASCKLSELSETDALFHRAIAQVTGNTLVSELLSASMDITAPLRTRTLKDRARRDLAARGHVAIAEAIARNDPQGARDAMMAHLNDARASL